MTTLKTSNKGIFGPDGKLITADEFASDLVVSYPWNKVAVGGFPGGGKSRTSAEIMAGIYNLLKKRDLLKYDAPLLCIDTEKAAQFLVEFFKLQGVPVKVKQTKSLADVQTAFELASAGHFFGVYIDSVTHIVKEFREAWMAKNNCRKMVPWQHGIVNNLWETEFGQKMTQSDTHVVFTGRGTYEYEDVEETDSNGTTTKKSEKSGVKMQITKDTAFDPNLVIWMRAAQKTGKGGKPSVWREAFVMKDRNPDPKTSLDGKTFGSEKTRGPVWKDFAPHFEYLLKYYKPGTTIAGQTTSVNSVISDPVESDPNIQRRVRVIDEIKSQLNLVAPGMSPGEKQTKATMFSRAFNTPSFKAVETLSISELESGLEKIKADVANLLKVQEGAFA